MPLAELAVHEPDYKRLIAFLKAMELGTLTRRVADFAEIDAGAIDPDDRLKAGGVGLAPTSPASPTGARKEATKPAAAPRVPAEAEPSTFTPQALVAARTEAAR